MGFSQAGYLVTMMLIFLLVSPLRGVGGRARLVQDVYEELSGRVMASDGTRPFSRGHDDPGYNSDVRKLFARRRLASTEAGESASVSQSDDVLDEGQAASMDLVPVAAEASTRRRLPFYPRFIPKFPFFTFAKNNGTLAPSTGTPSPGHN